MRKIYFKYFAGYSSMESADVVEYPDDVTDEELHEDAWQGAKDFAESYGVYPISEYDEEDIPEDEEENYSDNIEGSWEDYNPEKHDGTY